MKTIIQAIFGLILKKTPQLIKWGFALLLALPTLAMACFVNHQNKERSFVQQYAWVWLVALVCWMCLTVYCYKIDYEVLYALKYSSTYDAAISWKEACFHAAIIQFLLLVCGGGFFKTLIFVDFIKSVRYPTKTKETPHPFPKITFSPAHALQLMVLGALFTYGFYWTLTLSQKTGALARVEAQVNVEEVANDYEEKTSAIQSTYEEKTAAYRADAQKQIATIASNYAARIESSNKKYAAIIAGYEARYTQGSITKAHLQKRKSGYQTKKENIVAPLLKERAEKIEAIQAALTSQLNSARGLHTDGKRAIDHQASSDRTALDKQIAETAKTTQGRNVQFNFLNQLLWVALLLFAKSAQGANSAPEPSGSGSKKRATHASHTEKRGTHTAAAGTHATHASHTNNLHSTTQADGWQKFRWPRLGEEPLTLVIDGYSIRATAKTVWVEYGDKFYSIATVKSWAKKYEDRGQLDSEKYKEYCKMIAVLELAIRDLDKQEPLQAAG
ncbi:MAG: hypothetical protein ACRBFS_21715 [Aureispira sp.]